MRPTARIPTTVVVRRRFAAEVHTPHPAVTSLLTRTVPSTGREWLPERRAWLVLDTRVDGLLGALAAADLPAEVDDRRDGRDGAA